MRAAVAATRVAIALLIVVLLAVALLAGAWWFATTEAGLRWAGEQAAARSGGRVQIEGATGSLGGIVRIARLTYADENVSLIADNVAFSWSPRALFSRSIVVDTLSAATVTLDFKLSAGPSAPPASLALPWPIDVRRANIAALTVASGPNRWRVTQLAFHYTGAPERHALDALALDSEWGSVRGRLAVGATPPFAAEGSIRFAGSEAARRAIATVAVGGDLTTLALSGEGTVDGGRGSGTARLAPFEARQLREFEFRVENVDLARFDATLPHTEFQATLAGTGRDDGGVRGTLAARNNAPGPWSAGRLPVVNLTSGFSADFSASRSTDSMPGWATRAASPAPPASIMGSRPGSSPCAIWTSVVS